MRRRSWPKAKERRIGMVAYEFYRVDKLNGCHLIGILPERRKNPERITEESVMEWVKKLLDDSEDLKNIFFVKVTFSGFEDARGTDKGCHSRKSGSPEPTEKTGFLLPQE